MPSNTQYTHMAEHRTFPTRRDLAAILFRQRRTILLVSFGVVGAMLLSGAFHRTYQAHMKILVLRTRMDAMVTASANAPVQNSAEITEQDLNSEVELLRSDDLLRKVVLVTGLQALGKQQSNDFTSERSTAEAIRSLGAKLEVEPLRKTNVIEVKYRDSDPHLAAAVLNAVAAAYLEKHRQVHRPSGELTFFDQQTEQFQRGLEQSHAKLAEFTQQSGIIEAQRERELTLLRLSDLEANANQADALAAETEQRIASMQAQLASLQPRITTTVRTGENLQLMQQLKSTLLNLELKRTELLTKFEASYPLVQETDKQIADTHAAIETEQIRPPTEDTTDRDPTYVTLRSDLAKAEADLTGFRARSTATKTIARQYREAGRVLVQKGIQQEDLERTAKSQEETYLLYLRKREEARISDALDQRGIVNIALAEEPTVPMFPVRSLARSGGITFLLAIFVGFGAGFIKDFADPCFRTPDEVAGYLDITVLASLPKTHPGR